MLVAGIPCAVGVGLTYQPHVNVLVIIATTAVVRSVLTQFLAGQANMKSVKQAIPTAYQVYFGPRSPSMAAQEEVERNFFGNIRLSNGTYKFTYGNRLDDFNALLWRWIPFTDELEVMDVGASSGASALAWSESLTARGIAHRMTVGDIHINCTLVSLCKHLRVLVDDTGHPLQFDVLGTAMANPPSRRKWWWAIPFLAILGLIAKLASRHLARGTGPKTKRSFLTRFASLQPVVLMSPRLIDAAQVRIVEDDITRNQSLLGRFDVVRVANLLNRDYFDDATLQNIIRNLRRRLRPGGLLAVCTTHSDIRSIHGRFVDVPSAQNHGTLFILRDDDCMEAIDRIGNGSSVESVVLGANDKPATMLV
jgi:SAM-dependent methyltransferase